MICPPTGKGWKSPTVMMSRACGIEIISGQFDHGPEPLRAERRGLALGRGSL
jgi:hypothetical protein